MSLVNTLRKKMMKVYKSKAENSAFSKDYILQKDILTSFQEPKDNVERSYNQYLCQMSSIPFTIRFLQNIIAAFLLPVYMIKGYQKIKKTNGNSNSAIFIMEGVNRSIIPETLQGEFSTIFDCPYTGSQYLGPREKKFIFRIIKKHWYSPFFCLKVILKIGLYSAQIYRYQPKAVIVHNEYSFTSSILTDYCQLAGVEHINVMHGEKLFNIRDAFVVYNRFYVWDEHYVKLFEELQSPKNQFIVEVPSFLKQKPGRLKEYKYQYTYYLGNEREDELEKIKRILLNLDIPREKIGIRFHPRYSNQERISYIFEGFSIESPSEIPLNISLAQTHNVISLYSTVLFQAYRNGKSIIVDDLTSPKKYEKLKKLKYIMINKPHRCLSDLFIKNTI